MCKFCDMNDKKAKQFEIKFRTTCVDDISEDTTCEMASPDIYKDEDGTEYNMGSKCDDCGGCRDGNHKFTMLLYRDDNYNETRFNVGYIQHVKELHILPVSESIRINFCPMCGRQISDGIVAFEDMSYIKEI